MNRLQRRLTILRAKRNGCFDANQHYLERAVRARCARRIRTLLRLGRPVVLITPRWSRSDRFLDDIATDLQVGEPQVTARVLSLMWLQGKGTHDTWTWLVRAMSELCDVDLEGPVAQAVDRHGFRHVVAGLLRRVQGSGRRVLLMHGVQYLNLEARNDLIRVFEEHQAEFGADLRFNLLMASSVDGPTFEVERAERFFLPDFGSDEAIEALVEYLGPREQADLERAAGVSGGVPSILHALGLHAEEHGELAGTNEAVWRVIGPLGHEIRDASAILTSDDALASRLELLSSEGTVPRDDQVDPKLVRAGLVRDVLVGGHGRVALRAPFFADLADHG